MPHKFSAVKQCESADYFGAFATTYAQRGTDWKRKELAGAKLHQTTEISLITAMPLNAKFCAICRYLAAILMPSYGPK